MSRHMSNSEVLSNPKGYQQKYPPPAGVKWKEIKMNPNSNQSSSKEVFRKFEPNRDHSLSQDKSDKEILKGIKAQAQAQAQAHKLKNTNSNSNTSLHAHHNLVKVQKEEKQSNGGGGKNLLAESNVFIGSNHNNISNASINRIHYAEIHQLQKEFLKFKQQIFIELQRQKQLLSKMAADIIKFVNAEIQKITKITKITQAEPMMTEPNTKQQTIQIKVQIRDAKFKALKLHSTLYEFTINERIRRDQPQVNPPEMQPKPQNPSNTPLTITDSLPISSSYDVSAFQKIIKNISNQINEVGSILDSCNLIGLLGQKSSLSIPK